MPSINGMMPARFFTAEHLETPLNRVIESVSKENTAPEGKKVETKAVIRFEEEERGCVVNRERAAQLIEIFGSDDIDAWVGKEVTLVRGKTKFGGKQVACVAFAKAA